MAARDIVRCYFYLPREVYDQFEDTLPRNPLTGRVKKGARTAALEALIRDYLRRRGHQPADETRPVMEDQE